MIRNLLIITGLAIVLLLQACGKNAVTPNASPTAGKPDSAKKIKIGLSMDTLKEERWVKDRDLFVKRAEELGAEVIVQSAEGKDETQLKQVENMLTQGIDVLVIIPHNAEVAATMVEAAKKRGVPVLSYDRLIKNSEVDLYISFDNEKVGELQAKYLTERAPKGNYILIGGAPTDNNAKMFRDGQMRVLQPFIDRKEINVVADQWARDWLADEALKHTENALTQNRSDVIAVLASNDATAGGAVQALDKVGLTKKVFVSGQDADLAALQRIIAGTQSMTIYKPVSVLAVRAADAAFSLANREVINASSKVNNGKIDVPSILLEPIMVDRGNLDTVVIKDGFHSRDDVYRNAK